MLPCKAKKEYLITLQADTLQSSIEVLGFIVFNWLPW